MKGNKREKPMWLFQTTTKRLTAWLDLLVMYRGNDWPGSRSTTRILSKITRNTPCVFGAFLMGYVATVRSRDSSVSTVTGYGLDNLVSIPGMGSRIFSSPVSRPRLGSTQPSIQRVLVFISPRVKRQANYSPPFSADVNNARTIPQFLHRYSWCSA
jgi:hypothetical protein